MTRCTGGAGPEPDETTPVDVYELDQARELLLAIAVTEYFSIHALYRLKAYFISARVDESLTEFLGIDLPCCSGHPQRAVGRTSTLAHHALEALLLGHTQERQAVLEGLGREPGSRSF